MLNVIRWFESAAMDAPELKSPQPCPRGIHCNYMVKNSDVWEPGCCRGVHPGEEGTGRRIFPARQIKITGAEAEFIEQPACVRLTRADYYERRRLRLSWGQWCERQGIPYEPIKTGESWEPVKRSKCGKQPAITCEALEEQLTGGNILYSPDPPAPLNTLPGWFDIYRHVEDENACSTPSLLN